MASPAVTAVDETIDLRAREFDRATAFELIHPAAGSGHGQPGQTIFEHDQT